MAIYKRTAPVGLASDTSANGTARNGAALPTELIHPGMCMVECTGTITTASVVATYKLQATADGTNWVDLKSINNAASVTIAGGGGSPLAHSVSLDVPLGIHVYKSIRAVATLSGAATAAEDLTSVTYRTIQPGGVFFN